MQVFNAAGAALAIPITQVLFERLLARLLSAPLKILFHYYIPFTRGTNHADGSPSFIYTPTASLLVLTSDVRGICLRS